MTYPWSGNSVATRFAMNGCSTRRIARGALGWGRPSRPRPRPRPPTTRHATCVPGNERIAGRNPDYAGVYVFPNDLPTFSNDAPEPGPGDEFYQTRRAAGAGEVICYHPNHAMTFADLTQPQAGAVVETWRERSRVLGARREVRHVLIFENKGSVVGTSNPHPHCQLYAGNLIYGISERERDVGRRFHAETGRFLGLDVAEREGASERVVCENDAFLACVPWFARYAYEMLILPKTALTGLADLSDEQIAALGALMREVAVRYDNLWRMPMPYVMAIHQAPCDGEDSTGYPFHIEYHPPLRKPDTLKYLAGPEIGGGSMTNESNPDEKAAELRAVAPRLYRDEESRDEESSRG